MRDDEAAWFEHTGEHEVQHNRDDSRTSSLSARGIRYRADRFIVKFRKRARLGSKATPSQRRSK
jgi:predicted methyltransferase